MRIARQGWWGRQCFPLHGLRRGTDICKYEIPNPCGSEVFALPLSSGGGEGLRGTRANAVLVDEGLLITKEIQEFIIRPFLTAKLNFQEEKEIAGFVVKVDAHQK